MRIIIILSLFFFNYLLSQDKHLDSFLGIKWGSSIESAKKIMLQRKNVTVDKKNSKDGVLIFDGGEFGGFKVFFWQLMFDNELGFVMAVVKFKEKEHKIISLYNNIKESIITKYGEPFNTREDFDSPYYEGDGYETQAISLGKGHFGAVWKFQSSSEEENYITLIIDENLIINLSYTNMEASKKSLEKEKKKTIDDF